MFGKILLDKFAFMLLRSEPSLLTNTKALSSIWPRSYRVGKENVKRPLKCMHGDHMRDKNLVECEKPIKPGPEPNDKSEPKLPKV